MSNINVNLADLGMQGHFMVRKAPDDTGWREPRIEPVVVDGEEVYLLSAPNYDALTEEDHTRLAEKGIKPVRAPETGTPLTREDVKRLREQA